MIENISLIAQSAIKIKSKQNTKEISKKLAIVIPNDAITPVIALNAVVEIRPVITSITRIIPAKTNKPTTLPLMSAPLNSIWLEIINAKTDAIIMISFLFIFQNPHRITQSLPCNIVFKDSLNKA